ncbi:thiamine pyrophosphate-binding protein [Agrococcus casei]|uniref:thiamine pyrophosphate-binding protein n=1 Tax=Agrococcus casei TaxID=343512 RepID=UPI003F93B385
MQTIEKRTTGWVLLETLRNYGIDTVFGIPGTHNLELYRPLTALGIRAVTTRHEQGAGYGSDGWSLQKGLPGVVMTTSGPGLLNALSSAATAFAESRPMILLAPGVARGAEFADVGTLHETKDQLAAAQAVVEWGRRVESAEEAVQAVHDAFKLFRTGRPRPVYIEVPLDVLEAETTLEGSVLEAVAAPAPAQLDTAAVAEGAALLKGAENPVIFAGGGSRGAAAGVKALAEKLGAPVVTSTNGKGVLDEHHPLSLGANLRLEAARNVAKTAEVLLVIGSKLGEADLWVDALEAEGKVVRIDVLESQINKNQRADVGIVGDAAAAVDALILAIGDVEPKNAVDVAAVLEAVEAESYELDAHNTEIGKRIAQALPADVILSTDSSKIAYWGLLNMLKVSKPNSVQYMATYATLGYGLPAAIGARIADPSRPSVLVIGDGALMFSVQEFITAVEQQLDVVVIVVDNGGYAEIKGNEAAVGIAPIGVDLVQPDWAALVTAFGGTGMSIDSIDQIDQAVEQAVAAGGVQLIHVPTVEPVA